MGIGKEKRLSLCGFILILMLSSCSLERRTYLPGFNVQWNRWKKNGYAESGIKKAVKIKVKTNGMDFGQEQKNAMTTDL